MANLIAIWLRQALQTQSSRKNQYDVRGNIDGDRLVDLQVTDDERSNYYCALGARAAFRSKCGSERWILYQDISTVSHSKAEAKVVHNP